MATKKPKPMKVRVRAAENATILNSKDLYAVMQKVLLRENKIDRNKEHFWVIRLATNHTILNIELISLGTVNATLVEPMEVFSIALQKRSVKIMLVHNHPSGSTTPSEEDVDLTDHLYQVGLFLKVPVLDHLIITEKKYLSFEDSGLLKHLAKSKRYVLPYKEKEQLVKEALRLGHEAGKQEGKQEGRSEREKEMARVLLANGIKPEVISKATGLKVAELKKLIRSGTTIKRTRGM